MKIISLILFLGLNNLYFSQFKQLEIGIDGSIHAGTTGGNYTYGIKPAFEFSNNFVFGPSFRQIHYYSNFNGISGSTNINGFGLFAHYRYLNTLFCGLETELFNLPNGTQIISNSNFTNWIPTLFLGGGFSKEYKEKIRLNLGVYYDLINAVNSPMRGSYVMKNSLNQYIPIIYRFAVYIPIYKTKKEEPSYE